MFSIRNFLESLLFTLKLPTNIEIYPKQTELGKDAEGNWNMGQYINLPYYNKTERVAFNLDGTTFLCPSQPRKFASETTTPSLLIPDSMIWNSVSRCCSSQSDSGAKCSSCPINLRRSLLGRESIISIQISGA